MTPKTPDRASVPQTHFAGAAPATGAAHPRRPLLRDARLDTFRGLALVFMTGAHLPFALGGAFKGWLGFAAFTHVFIFLSGLVAGLVYAHRAADMSTRDVWTKAFRRSAWIWAVHVLVIVFFTAYLLLLRASGSDYLPDGAEFLAARPGVGIVLAAAMLYLPGYTHILPLYVVFVAVLPPAVLGLLRGRWVLVLGTSFGFWLAAQMGLREAVDLWLDDVVVHRLAHFDVFAWQLLFVGGIAVGVGRARDAFTRWRIPAWALVAALVAHGALALVRHRVLPPGELTDWVWSWAYNPTLGVFRLVDFLFVLVLAVWLTRRHPRWVTNRWLALLGRHSMAVFLFHLILVYLLAPLEVVSWSAQITIAAVALASLTLPAWAIERGGSRVPARPSSAQ